MTAVTEAALARLKASIQKSSSMKLSLAGKAVPWIKKTSRPRTFSPTRTKRLPSENWSVSPAPSGQSRYLAMAWPSLRLADPAKSEHSPSGTEQIYRRAVAGAEPGTRRRGQRSGDAVEAGGVLEEDLLLQRLGER